LICFRSDQPGLNGNGALAALSVVLMSRFFSGGNELDSIQKEQEFNIQRGLTIPATKSVFFTEKRDGVCPFCHRPDKGKKRQYTSEKDIEFICSACVQHLLNADQDCLRQMHKLATKHSDKGKVSAIESFLIPEGQSHEQRKPKSKFRININRKRSVRSVRNKEERIRLATA
jgi:hypothetical protein